MDRRALFKNGAKLLAASGLNYGSKAFGYSFKPTRDELIQSLTNQALTRITFGSCNRQGASQDYWNIIAKTNPDLWIWLGDNIYGDGLSLEQRAQTYQKLKFETPYANFREQTPIMATWDDHDYASDNQGRDFKDKDFSQELFMDFVGYSLSNPLRNQQGVYHSQSFGPVGKQTLIINLDLRYFKAKPRNNEEGLLGEIQWQWFEQELLNSSADLIILGSSVHVCSNVTGFGLEGWRQYPTDRQRLFKLIDQLSVPVVVISGDRHMAEFTKTTLNSGKTLYEFMSSGLTHSVRVPLPDNDRIGKTIGKKNFGLIDIDWSLGRPDLTFRITSAESGESLQEHSPNFASNFLSSDYRSRY